MTTQTPITDAALLHRFSTRPSELTIISHWSGVARSLERDKATLRAALAEIAGYDNGFGTLQEFARDTLAQVQS